MATEYKSFFESMKTLPRKPVNMVAETTQSCKSVIGFGDVKKLQEMVLPCLRRQTLCLRTSMRWMDESGL